jgi:hypothetical protein
MLNVLFSLFFFIMEHYHMSMLQFTDGDVQKCFTIKDMSMKH